VLADLDGDDDLDAFVGIGYGKNFEYGYVQYFENTGTPTDSGFLAPGDRLDLVDVDGDGDLDALVSHFAVPSGRGGPPMVGELEIGSKSSGSADEHYLSIWYFENIGTVQEPSWQLRTGLDNPFCTFNDTYTTIAGGFILAGLAPTVGHLDDDGLLDAFIGTPNGKIQALEDDGTGQLMPWDSHPLDGVDFGYDSHPHLVDANGDGELDLLVGYTEYDDISGNYYSRVAFFFNPTGPAGLGTTPDMVLDFGDEIYLPAPVMADLDGDGDLDLLVGGATYEFLSQTLFLENTGTLMAPAFDVGSAEQVQVLIDPPNAPAVGDVNGDGFPDLLIGNRTGTEFFLTEMAILEVTKEVTGGDMAPGGTVQYTIVITNVGTGTQPDDPANPELTDTLPPELTLVSAMVTSGPGGVTTSGNTLRYDGEIPAGESVTILVEATIPIASAGTTVENQAVAFFDMDGDGENDTEEPSDDPTTAAVDDPTLFMIGGNDLGPPEIPTLSQWGAMLFAGLLSLLGLFGLRRLGG
jgi:uncharacterized repeat protein (TIGR01451 family)